jgi:glycosyltransferase involved in cell wall biosynthesis
MHDRANTTQPTLYALMHTQEAIYAAKPLAVIMSVYEGDTPELFERALLSVIRQDWKHSPIHIYLCIDGPVPSGITAVIEKHQKCIYKILRNDTRRGLAASLNRLLDTLEGESFVFRMDSDDFSHPDRFRRQIDAMLGNPSIDILGTAINEVDLSGRVMHTVRYPRSQREVLLALPRRSPVAHPTVCFRRSAIDRFKNYPVTRVNQDWALWYKCVAMGMVISNIDDVLFDVTISDAFFKRRGFARAIEEFKISMKGIWITHGLTWRMVFPFLRAAFRLTPKWFRQRMYRSRLR